MRWMGPEIRKSMAILQGPAAGFMEWGVALAEAFEKESKGKPTDWAAHAEGRHRFHSGAAFIEAIRDSRKMQRLDFCAEIFAPLARRALGCSRRNVPCDRPRHVSKEEALAMCAGAATPQGSMLAMVACLGFSPKVFVRCTPEVWALTEEMEAVAQALAGQVPAEATGHGALDLTDAELRGVHASACQAAGKMTMRVIVVGSCCSVLL